MGTRGQKLISPPIDFFLTKPMSPIIRSPPPGPRAHVHGEGSRFKRKHQDFILFFPRFFNLHQHIYMSGIWLGLAMRIDTKKTYV
jgi:hypothetical protein